MLGSEIVAIPKLFTATLCNTYLAFLQKSISLTTTPGKPKIGEAVRVNDRFQITDPEFAKTLWEQSGLKDVIGRKGEAMWGGEVVGLNPNIRIYRYRKGQFFDKHCSPPGSVCICFFFSFFFDVSVLTSIIDDDSVSLSFGSPPVPCRTTWTLLIYITGQSDGVVGGETVFYTRPRRGEEVVVEPEKGLALLHKHGADCMLHEGRLVSEDGGVGKWVLRSDLVVKL